MTTSGKKAFVLLWLLVLSSCTMTIKSPVTQVEYTGQINQEGISIVAVPPFWAWAVDFYKSFK